MPNLFDAHRLNVTEALDRLFFWLEHRELAEVAGDVNSIRRSQAAINLLTARLSKEAEYAAANG